MGDQRGAPPDLVGRMREAELRAAASVLGVRQVCFLDYVDKSLDAADASEAVGRIVTCIRRIRPQIVVTFGPDGTYGHPDHIAISQLTTAALMCAADAMYGGGRPHRVDKLYYMVWDENASEAYQAALKKLTVQVDDVERQATPWPNWAITTEIDTGSFWPVVWRAVSCHNTQMSIYGQLEHLPESQHRAIWGRQTFYRAFSTVNGGRRRETDLFEGLR
jgi:LmbE family N-acetylglucosaminyl deacetylase